MGGIRTGLDALEFLLAGASAVSVGTVVFHDPSAPARVLRELAHALAERGVSRLSDIVGLAHRPPAPGLPRVADPPGDPGLDEPLDGPSDDPAAADVPPLPLREG